MLIKMPYEYKEDQVCPKATAVERFFHNPGVNVFVSVIFMYLFIGIGGGLYNIDRENVLLTGIAMFFFIAAFVILFGGVWIIPKLFDKLQITNKICKKEVLKKHFSIINRFIKDLDNYKMGENVNYEFPQIKDYDTYIKGFSFQGLYNEKDKKAHYEIMVFVVAKDSPCSVSRGIYEADSLDDIKKIVKKHDFIEKVFIHTKDLVKVVEMW